MTRYWCMSDGVSCESCEAPTLAAACHKAREWADDGDWREKGSIVLSVSETDEDGAELEDGEEDSFDHDVGCDPEPPACVEDEDGDELEHDWQSPEWLGGCRENPGVWGLGGAAIGTTECCAHCGAYRRTLHRGAQRNPGEAETQVSYDEADEQSREWVEGLATA